MKSYFNCAGSYLGSPDPDTDMFTLYTDWNKFSVTYFSARKRRDYLILIKYLPRTVLNLRNYIYKMTNSVQTNNGNLFSLESEDESGSEQEAAPRTYTKEEEENLLKSESDDMDVDGDSFHSAQGESPHQQGKHTISRVYKSVRAAKLAAMTCRSLSSAGTRPLSPVGSFVNPKDGRDSRAFNINSFIARRNISASFDLESLKCITCPLKPDHIVLYRELKEH